MDTHNEIQNNIDTPDTNINSNNTQKKHLSEAFVDDDNDDFFSNMNSQAVPEAKVTPRQASTTLSYNTLANEAMRSARKIPEAIKTEISPNAGPTGSGQRTPEQDELDAVEAELDAWDDDDDDFIVSSHEEAEDATQPEAPITHSEPFPEQSHAVDKPATEDEASILQSQPIKQQTEVEEDKPATEDEPSIPQSQPIKQRAKIEEDKPATEDEASIPQSQPIKQQTEVEEDKPATGDEASIPQSQPIKQQTEVEEDKPATGDEAPIPQSQPIKQQTEAVEEYEPATGEASSVSVQLLEPIPQSQIPDIVAPHHDDMEFLDEAYFPRTDEEPKSATVTDSLEAAAKQLDEIAQKVAAHKGTGAAEQPVGTSHETKEDTTTAAATAAATGKEKEVDVDVVIAPEADLDAWSHDVETHDEAAADSPQPLWAQDQHEITQHEEVSAQPVQRQREVAQETPKEAAAPAKSDAPFQKGHRKRFSTSQIFADSGHDDFFSQMKPEMIEEDEEPQQEEQRKPTEAELAAKWEAELAAAGLMGEYELLDDELLPDSDGEGFLDDELLPDDDLLPEDNQPIIEALAPAPQALAAPPPNPYINRPASYQPTAAALTAQTNTFINPVEKRPQAQSKAQSFVAKAREGYASPYDLPMDLAPKKRQSTRRLASQYMTQAPVISPPRGPPIAHSRAAPLSGSSFIPQQPATAAPHVPPPVSNYMPQVPQARDASPYNPPPQIARLPSTSNYLPQAQIAAPARPPSTSNYLPQASIVAPARPPSTSNYMPQPQTSPPPRPPSSSKYAPQPQLDSPAAAPPRTAPPNQAYMPQAHAMSPAQAPPRAAPPLAATYLPRTASITSPPLAPPPVANFRARSIAETPRRSHTHTDMADPMSRPVAEVPRRSQTQSPETAMHGRRTQRQVSYAEPHVVPASKTRGRAPSKSYNYIAPSDGREQDPLQRWRGAPVFAWGAAGTLITTFPKDVPRYSMGSTVPQIQRTPGEVKIRSIKDVYPLEGPEANIPGPLKGKGKKKEVVAWLTSGLEAQEKLLPTISYNSVLSLEDKRREERILLWKVLRVMVEHDGVLEGKPEVDKAVRAVLTPELASSEGHKNNGEIYRSMGAAPLPDPCDPAALNEIMKFLLAGEREKAVWKAVDHRLWAQAMLMSTALPPGVYKRVAQEFIQKEIKEIGENTESLAALYEVFAGNHDDCIDELVPPSARAGLSMINVSGSGPQKGALEGLDKWRETLALILSNRTLGDVTAIHSLAKLLASYDRTEAAHICFIFARLVSVFAGVDDANADIVLVGADHKRSPFDFDKNLESIELTEVYEYALSLAATSSVPVSVPHLAAYKLQHAKILGSFGLRTRALEYCESIASIITAQTKRSPYHHGAFMSELDDLIKRLKQSPKDETSSWIAKPTMDKVSSTFFTKFNKFVAGGDDEDDASAPVSGSVESGPFARVQGGTPTISRSPSVDASYQQPQGGMGLGMAMPPYQSGAMPIPTPSGSAGRYAPGGSAGSSTLQNQLLPGFGSSVGSQGSAGGFVQHPPSFKGQQQTPEQDPRTTSRGSMRGRYAPAVSGGRSSFELGTPEEYPHGAGRAASRGSMRSKYAPVAPERRSLDQGDDDYGRPSMKELEREHENKPASAPPTPPPAPPSASMPNPYGAMGYQPYAPHQQYDHSGHAGHSAPPTHSRTGTPVNTIPEEGENGGYQPYPPRRDSAQHGHGAQQETPLEQTERRESGGGYQPYQPQTMSSSPEAHPETGGKRDKEQEQGDNVNPYASSEYQPYQQNSFEPPTMNESNFGKEHTGGGGGFDASASIADLVDAGEGGVGDYSSYTPPQSGGYAPPAYEPYTGPDEDEDMSTKPRRQQFGDQSDDGMVSTKPTKGDGSEGPRGKSKAEKDREADEAFRRAAEEDGKLPHSYAPPHPTILLEGLEANVITAKRDQAKSTPPSKKGWGLGGWFKKSSIDSTPSSSPQQQANKPIRAKLGEESSFVYDPERKRWVNKKTGVENNEKAKATPPPPKGPPRMNTASQRSGSAPPVPPLPMQGLSRAPSPAMTTPPGTAMPPPRRQDSDGDRLAPPAMMRSASNYSSHSNESAQTAPTPNIPRSAPGTRPGTASGAPAPAAIAPPGRVPRKPKPGAATFGIDDLLGPAASRKRDPSAAKKKRGGRYVDIMADKVA